MYTNPQTPKELELDANLATRLELMQWVDEFLGYDFDGNPTIDTDCIRDRVLKHQNGIREGFKTEMEG
jgi:hypothetical protein